VISVALLALILLPLASASNSGLPPATWPLAGEAQSIEVGAGATSPVREALREGKFPWYDPATDRVQPIWPVRYSWMKWLSERIDRFVERIRKFLDRLRFAGGPGLGTPGDSIGTLLLVAALVAFFASLIVLWFRREAGARVGEGAQSRLGTALRLGELPEGIRPGDGDPWAEAQRRRAAGDLAGSIVCLFAHQLLTLDQLGLIRLAPGRTGRHYVHSLRDQELGDALGATLHLFEDVYYGHRTPSVRAFESVWKQALEFQERRRVMEMGAMR
jgi:hypothetical protein